MLYSVLGQVHVPDNDSDDDLRAKEDVKVSNFPQCETHPYGPQFATDLIRQVVTLERSLGT